MHIVAAGERGAEGFVVGDLSEEAELGLAEVGVDKHPVGLRGANVGLHPRGEVLGVWISTRQSSGIGPDHL